MKKILTAALLAILLSAQANAQAKDRKNIDKLCGCFDVEFKYAETFSPDPSYKFRDRKQMGALELAIPVESSDKKIVIQHLLVAGDTTVIKHWREDWVYEQPYLWQYQDDKKWTKQQLKPVEYKGKWTQTVWEVDDAPRYQGISDWVHTDGRTFWLSTTNAPLPRREYTTRNDYNILKRGNRLVLTDSGWIHEQDNDKVLVKGNTTKLIAQEKGWNIYTRVDEEKCAYARQWWTSQAPFWSKVRNEWEELLRKENTINLQSKVDNKFLYQYLDELEEQLENKAISLDAVSTRTREILRKFVRATSDVALN